MSGNIQHFFESTQGQILSIAVIAVALLLIMIGDKKSGKKTDTKALTISALMIAMAIVLNQIKLFHMPQGGSVTLLSLLPIVLVGYFCGPRRGIIAGICVGMLDLILNPYVIHPIQLLVDYPLAFGALGMSGLMKDKKNGLTKGYILGVFSRYICAVISGIVFFGAYAPKNFNAVTWSLWYNLTYLGAEAVITLVIINIPPVKSAFQRMKNSIENGR